MHTYTCIQMHTHMHTHTHTYTHTYTHTHARTHTHICRADNKGSHRTFTHLSNQNTLLSRLCVLTLLKKFPTTLKFSSEAMHTYIYIYAHIYTHIHTHTNTYSQYTQHTHMHIHLHAHAHAYASFHVKHGDQRVFFLIIEPIANFHSLGEARECAQLGVSTPSKY